MKNLNLLNLSKESTDLLLSRMDLHRRYSNISFRLVSANDNEVVIVVHQGESFHQNKFNHKRLREIAHETFSDIITQHLHVSIKTDIESPPDIVSVDWIVTQKNKHKKRIQDIVNDTGIHKSTISSYINGHKPLSHVVKCLFYYYFKSLE